MKLLLLNLWLWLLLSVPVAAAAPPQLAEVLVLRDTAQTHRLNKYLAVLEAPQAEQFRLEQIQTKPLTKQFTGNYKVLASNTKPGHYWWLRGYVRSEAAASTHWLLQLQTETTADIEVYAVRANGQVQQYRLNTELPHNQTRVFAHRHYNVRLELPAGETVTLYLRAPTGESIFTGISEQAYLLQQARQYDLIMGPYFGILLALLAYNALLYLSTRDRSYLVYVLYVASFSLLQFDMTGYMRLYWSEGMTGYALELRQNLLLSLAVFFGTLTARAFLETKRTVPRFDKLLQLTLGLAWLPVLAVLLRLGYQLELLATVSTALWTSAVLLTAGVVVLLTGYKPARYYMFGWTLLLLAVVNYYLGLIGITPRSGFWAAHGVHVASALEMILLSLGLADRINLAKRDKHLAQQSAIRAMQEKEAAQDEALAALRTTQMAQEQALQVSREKEELQQRSNQELAERAAELQRAYQELHASIRTSHKLQELDELKTKFFTNISHELRTPLTLIISPLEQLVGEARQRPEDHSRPEYALMLRNARRLLQLINQLLDIARLEAGQLRLAAAPVDLVRTVRTGVLSFDSLAVSHAVDLRFESNLTDLEVYVDGDQLDKILYNLLGNALKFTPAGGTVVVSIDRHAGHAVLRIRDTGIGIPAEHLPFIFDRFHQVDDNRTRRYEGSGIGLALVKELVALHRGHIRVSSAVGQGTTFVVELPLGKAHLSAAELRPADAVPAPVIRATLVDMDLPLGELSTTNCDAGDDQHRPLVMLVEDNAEVREYVRSCLANDFRVMTAEDGEQGLERIIAAVPDLVVSDLMMPRLDGQELCRRLRADERTSHIPVILLTARAGDEERVISFELGADEYLTKPFRPEELRARVHNLIRQRELLRQRFGREVTLRPRDIAITSTDEMFLNRAMTVVEHHLTDSDFSVEQFADEMALSRVQLHRKLKALTDQSTSEFVRNIRLRRAAVLLQSHAGNVAEVAESVGFANLSYFSKCFRELYRQSPSEYAAGTVEAE